jgi:uncharacterized membrane protein YgaE (UPF0421/DUF939 family)
MPWDRLAASFRQHPRIARAAKAAFATAVAWAVVQPMGGVAADYPYYAPLGALIAVSRTVADSVRGSLQGLLAIVLGSALALGIGMVDVPEVAAVGIAVATATLVAGWWRVGAKADWVPLTALFVLIVGNEHPLGYAMAYLGLTALGACVGIAVNLAFPPIPLTATQSSVTRLRRELSDQLEELAQGLLQETPPDAEGWSRRQRAIRPLTLQMRDMVAQATEARRGNWRIARWQREADRQYEQARALEQLAFLVEQMTSFVVVTENAERDEVALGPSLRPYAAHAFQETADTLRSVGEEGVDVALLREADAALSRLVDEVRDLRARQNSDLFGASTIVMTLRRAIGSLAPPELEEELPSA